MIMYSPIRRGLQAKRIVVLQWFSLGSASGCKPLVSQVVSDTLCNFMGLAQIHASKGTDILNPLNELTFPNIRNNSIILRASHAVLVNISAFRINRFIKNVDSTFDSVTNNSGLAIRNNKSIIHALNSAHSFSHTFSLYIKIWDGL
jgi:hypothetical protein